MVSQDKISAGVEEGSALLPHSHGRGASLMAITCRDQVVISRGCRAREQRKRQGRQPLAGHASTHLNASEDAMGVYSVLGTTEDGGCVGLTLIPCAVAANKRLKLVQGHLLEILCLTFFCGVTLEQSSVKAEAIPSMC